MRALLATAVVFLVSVGLGRRLLGRHRTMPADIALPLSVALGITILFLLNAVAGVLGWLSVRHQVLVIAAAGLVAAPGWPAAARDLRALYRELLPTRWGWRQLGLVLWVGTFLGLGLIASLAPPHDVDGLDYHLPFARRFLEAGRIVHLPFLENHKGSFPLGVELLFVMVMALGDDRGPALFELGCGGFLILLLYGWCRETVHRDAAIVISLSFVAAPVLVILLGSAFVDLTFILCAIASLVLALRGHGLASGLCAGFAASSKPLIGLIPIAIGILATFYLPRGRRRAWLVGFAPAAVALAAIWPLIRLWLTGNPVYPFIWGGFDVHPDVLDYSRQSALATRLNLIHLFAGAMPRMDPWRFAMTQGLVLVGLWVPAVAIGAIRRHTPLAVTASCFALVAIMAVNMRDRFVLLALIYAAPALALSWQRLLRSRLAAVRVLTKCLFVVGMGWGLLLGLKLQATHFGVAMGLESPHEYLARWFPDYPFVQAANRIVPRDGSVLRLCRLRTGNYYASFRMVTPLPLLARHGRGSLSAASFADLLQANRVSHIIECGNLNLLLREAEVSRFREQVREVHAQQGLSLLELPWDSGAR